MVLDLVRRFVVFTVRVILVAVVVSEPVDPMSAGRQVPIERFDLAPLYNLLSKLVHLEVEGEHAYPFAFKRSTLIRFVRLNRDQEWFDYLNEGRGSDPFEEEDGAVKGSVVPAALRAKAEVKIVRVGIFHDVPSVVVPSGAIHCTRGIKPWDIAAEKAIDDLVSVVCLSLNRCHHGFYSAVAILEANRHDRAKRTGHVDVSVQAEAGEA